MGDDDICSSLDSLSDDSLGDVHTAEDTCSHCRGIPDLKATVVIALLQCRRDLRL